MLEDLLAALYWDDSASHGFLKAPRGVLPSRTEKKRYNATAQQAQKREKKATMHCYSESAKRRIFRRGCENFLLSQNKDA
jgi:hypothetical protein